MKNSVELTNAVQARLSDAPSHTVVSMHRIVKETLAVLVEWGYLAYGEQEWGGIPAHHPGVRAKEATDGR